MNAKYVYFLGLLHLSICSFDNSPTHLASTAVGSKETENKLHALIRHTYEKIDSLRPANQGDEEFFVYIKSGAMQSITGQQHPSYWIKIEGQDHWIAFNLPIKGLEIQTGYQYKIKMMKVFNMVQQNTETPFDYQCLEIIEQIPLPPVLSREQIFLSKYPWRLIQLYGQSIQQNQPYIEFDWEKATLSGYTGCNQFQTSIQLQENRLTISAIATSLRTCQQVEFEQRFLSLFEVEDLRYDLADQTLNLYQHNKLVAIFGLVNYEETK